MKWIKTFESVSSQKILEKLTNDILIFIADKSYTNYIIANNENKTLELSDFYLRNFNYEIYDKDIQNFLRANLVGILFKKFKTTELMKTLGTYYNNSFIFLYYDDELLITINNDIKDKSYYNEKILYSKLYFEFYSTLLHELQHAYDSYLSKGKYTKTKKTYNHIKNKTKASLNYNSMSDDDYAKLDSIFNEYQKLPHEVNARFTQAIHKTKFWKLNDEKDNKWTFSKKSFKDVLKNFKYNFEGWNLMDEDIQKRLKQRIYNYWINDYDKKEDIDLNETHQ